MCCRLNVRPLDVELAAAMLEIGQFVPGVVPTADNPIPRFWRREIPEENCSVNVSLTGNMLEVSIAPSISAMDHHRGKRITAGVYFEIAARYAQKVGGEVTQRATVDGCKGEGETGALLVANYPEMPMDFSKICAGFQREILTDAVD